MKKLIKKLLREEISKCVQLFPTDEVINYIKNFDSDELLRVVVYLLLFLIDTHLGFQKRYN
jgi:hypothetical protein